MSLNWMQTEIIATPDLHLLKFAGGIVRSSSDIERVHILDLEFFAPTFALTIGSWWSKFLVSAYTSEQWTRRIFCTNRTLHDAGAWVGQAGESGLFEKIHVFFHLTSKAESTERLFFEKAPQHSWLITLSNKRSATRGIAKSSVSSWVTITEKK